MESQAEMQAEHEGQEGHGERQEQCVAPRRAAPAEPHKRQAVVAATVAAGDHVGTVIDISGPEVAAPVAAPTSGWKMVVRGRARSAATGGGGGGGRPKVAGGETGGRDAAGHERAGGVHNGRDPLRARV